MALAYYSEKSIACARSAVAVGGKSYELEHEVTSTSAEGWTEVKTFVYTNDSAGNRCCLGSASMLKAGSSVAVSLKEIPVAEQAPIVAQLYEDLSEISNR